jgi:hypothetical protein
MIDDCMLIGLRRRRGRPDSIRIYTRDRAMRAFTLRLHAAVLNSIDVDDQVWTWLVPPSTRCLI